jgi:uncharacterized protein YyaL (SSP411 family)
LIFGLLEVYTAGGKTEYLKEALRLQEEQERLFRDKVHGGYYFTGHDAEELLIRPKEIYDGAMPSGNSVSTANLIRLWRITGDQRWLELAEKQFATFRAALQNYPAGHNAFLQALQFYLGKSDELVLSGSLNSKTMADMQAIVFEDFRPFSVVIYNEGTVDQVIPGMRDYPVPDPASGQVTAYLCRNFACREPVDKPEKLKLLFRE